MNSQNIKGPLSQQRTSDVTRGPGHLALSKCAVRVMAK